MELMSEHRGEKLQLINLYVDKVIVYREHVEAYLNTIPMPMKANELNTELKITVSGQPLAVYIYKLYRVYKYKKEGSNILNIGMLETFAGKGTNY